MEKRFLPVKKKTVIEICLLLGFDENFENLSQKEKDIVTAVVFVAYKYDAEIVRIIFRKYKDQLLDNIETADIKLGIADNTWATIFINGIPQKWYDIKNAKFIDDTPIVLDARVFDIKGITKLIELRLTD